MRDKVLTWCRQNGLLICDRRIICAVSGGADSVAMLHLLLSLGQELGLTVEAAHFDHRLRGPESDRDAAFVRQLCRDRGVRLHFGSGDAAARAAETGESIEEAARNLRYRWFATLPGAVATAHTADDNLETVLLNLIRGTGLKGLCGIPPRRDSIIRPILCLTRAEVEQYLNEHHLPHVEDSTNASPDHLRNRLRMEALPLLRRENPALAHTVLRSCGLLQQDGALLDRMTEQALDTARLSENSWSVPALLELEEGLRGRVLRQLLTQARVSKPSAAHVQGLERLLQSPDPSARWDLPEGLRAAREYDRLLFPAPGAAPAWGPVTLDAAGETTIPALGLTVRCCLEKNPRRLAEIQNSPSTFVLHCGMMEAGDPLILRPRQTGDSLRLTGGVRSLKKLLIDRKVPAAQRDLAPVLADSRGVLAVYGIGPNLDFTAPPEGPALIVDLCRLPADPAQQ